MRRKLIGKPADWIAALAILVGCAWAAHGHANSREAEIYANGQLIARWPIGKQPKTFTVPGLLGPVVVRVDERGARIVHASCPEQRCVHSGAHWLPGDAAICAPNRVAVVIRGSARFDAVVE